MQILYYSLFPSFCLNIQNKTLTPLDGSVSAQGTLGVQGFAWSDTRSVGLTEVASLSLSPLAILPIKRTSFPR